MEHQFPGFFLWKIFFKKRSISLVSNPLNLVSQDAKNWSSRFSCMNQIVLFFLLFVGYFNIECHLVLTMYIDYVKLIFYCYFFKETEFFIDKMKILKQVARAYMGKGPTNSKPTK